MQMLNRALSPEQLSVARKLWADEEMSAEQRSDALDRRLRDRAAAKAEDDDRNRHERRKAAAMERRK